MVSFLENNKCDATALLWTVSIESLPIYVVRPKVPSLRSYNQLREFLKDKHAAAAKDRSDRIAVAGIITGQALSSTVCGFPWLTRICGGLGTGTRMR